LRPDGPLPAIEQRRSAGQSRESAGGQGSLLNYAQAESAWLTVPDRKGSPDRNPQPPSYKNLDYAIAGEHAFLPCPPDSPLGSSCKGGSHASFSSSSKLYSGRHFALDRQSARPF